MESKILKNSMHSAYTSNIRMLNHLLGRGQRKKAHLSIPMDLDKRKSNLMELLNELKENRQVCS